MKLVLLSLVCALGCGNKASGEASSPCAVANARDVEALAGKRGLDAFDAQLKTALAELCVKDQWSPAVIDCFAQQAELGTCRNQLTPEQRGRYTQTRMVINSKRVGRPVLRGSAGAGSGSGSGAGSAAVPSP